MCRQGLLPLWSRERCLEIGGGLIPALLIMLGVDGVKPFLGYGWWDIVPGMTEERIGQYDQEEIE